MKLDNILPFHDIFSANPAKLSRIEKLLAQIRWLISLTVIFFLLVGVSSIRVNTPVIIVFILINIIYNAIIHYEVHQRTKKKLDLIKLGIVSTVLDSAFITIFVYLTGGLESPFYLLYFLSILSVSMRFDLRPTLEMGVLNILLYFTIILVSGNSLATKEHLIIFTFRSICLGFAALFGGYLSREERQQRLAFEKEQKNVETTSTLLENLYKTKAELEKRFQQLETLYGVAQEISTHLELDKTLDVALRLTAEKMHARTGVLGLYDVRKRGLHFQATYGTPLSSIEYDKVIEPYKGKGIESWVITAQQPLIIPDVLEDNRWCKQSDEAAHTPFSGSAICVPLIAQGKVLGTITLTHQQKSFFGKDEEKMLLSISEQIALAVINSQLYTELNARVNALVGLNIMAASLSSTLETDEVLEAIYMQTKHIIKASYFRLLLKNPDDPNATFQRWYRPQDNIVEENVEIISEELIVAWVIQNQKYLVVHESKEREWKNYSIENYDPKIQSLLAVPLVAKDNVLGVMIVVDVDKGFAFLEEDINTLLTIGRYAGIALDNARLYQNTHRSLIERGRELQMLYHSSALIASAQTVKELPEFILRMTLNALVSDHGCFYLWNTDLNKAETAASEGYKDDTECDPDIILKGRLSEFLNSEKTVGEIHETKIPDFDYVTEDNIKTQYSLTVPCFFKDKLVGILHIERKTNQTSFSTHDLHLLSAIANHTAIAVERARLYQELQEHRKTLARLFSVVVTAQEDERQRMARDIHDGIAQTMYNCLYKIQTCTHLMSFDLGKAQQTLQTTESILRDCLVDIRRLLFDLRPAALDELGLIEALKVYLARFEQDHEIKTYLSLSENLQTDQDILPINHAAQVALYRIIQEGLNNVFRHANANNVKVSLGIFDNFGNPVELIGDRFYSVPLKTHSDLILRIEDDGIGLNQSYLTAGSEGHLGMAGMRERVEMLGGILSVHSPEGGGTIINVKVPIQSSAVTLSTINPDQEKV